MVSKGEMWGSDWNRIARSHSQMLDSLTAYHAVTLMNGKKLQVADYGVPSPPKIKVVTQHPTLHIDIGVCHVNINIRVNQLRT